MLSASNLTYALLEQKTLNDLDEYTDKTPSEILEDLQLKINSDLNTEKEKLSTIDANIRKFSKFSAKFVFILIAVSLMSLSLLLKAKNPHFDTNLFNISAWSLAAIIGIFGFLRWMELIPTKLKVESAVDDFLFHHLKNLLNKK